MMFKSILKPDTSVMLGLANGGIIVAIYNGTLPTAATIRTADPEDNDIEGARKAAAWTSAAVLGFMFLLTRDRNSFLIGGLVLGGIDLIVKHANGLNPVSGKLESGNDVALDDDAGNVYPLPDYSEETDPAEAM
jgi:hypothetical protein